MTASDEDQTNKGSCRAAPVLTIDYGLYEDHLEGADLTEDQKREFLAVLWSIIVEFVTLGFEVHPVQLAQSLCGQLPETRTNPPKSRRHAVVSKDIHKINFSEAAGGDRPQTAERIRK